jgi:ABC-type phosphate transport system permease subunit
VARSARVASDCRSWNVACEPYVQRDVFALFLILCLVALPLALWTVLDPRSAWRITTSWQFRHPKANEPSEAGYLVQRLAGAVTLVLTIVLIVMLVSMSK